MINRIKQYMTVKGFGLITLAAVALAFTLTGLGMGATFHWKEAAQENPQPGMHQAVTGAPAIPGSLAELAKDMSPTVVNIKVTKIENVGAQFMPFFKLFPNMMPQVPESRPVQGAGSGVIISSDGVILTNNHVVEGAKEVTVTLADKQEYTAQILGRDPKTDLAVLKIQPKGSLQAATLGDSDKLQVGDWVMAVGNPFGLSHTVTSGIVSAKGRVIGAGPYDNFIQTDASINPGNSGGPLYNMKGELVGINTAIVAQGQGIGFAIPVNTVKPLVPQLVAKGEVTRGYLGVNIQSITPELAKALNLKDVKGALVADVMSGSPAEKAGIQRGDVILSYQGKAVPEARDLSRLVAESPVGQDSSVTILRNGSERKVNVQIARMKSEKASEEATPQPASGKWGLLLQDLDAQTAGQLGLSNGQGVAVAAVQDGSPAERAGVHEGDVLLEVNRQPVHSARDAKEAITKSESKDSLLLLVQREGGRLFVALTA